LSPKRVFISYSHDSDDHRNWVSELASFFVKNGVDAFLDQWDLEFGDDLAAFMEKGITAADRVILVCTDAYIDKANAGRGGVGYEKTIVTAELMAGPDERRKFIPVVRNVTVNPKLPTFMGAKYYADLSDHADQDKVRDQLLATVLEVAPKKPALGAVPFIPADAPNDNDEVADAPRRKGESVRADPCVVFSERFGQAFPGVRGIQWFEENEVISERLGILLSEPHVFDNGTMAWWWRGSRNMHVTRFMPHEGSHYLLNSDELNISKIAAVHGGDYYRCYVYIEAKPDECTGLYDWPEEKLKRSLEVHGYADEEYGLVDGTLPISRVEYDDGAAIVEGRPVDVRGRVELRSRYITPYNLLIAPNCSPINNSKFDSVQESLLNGILQGSATLDDLASKIQRLPRRH
jgi:TIR domain